MATKKNNTNNIKKNTTKKNAQVQAPAEKAYFGFVEKTTKSGEPLFAEVCKFPKGVKLTSAQVDALHEAGFFWLRAPLACWNRYVNPQSGFAVKWLAAFGPLADAEHPTHDEYAAFQKRVKAYYQTPEGIARQAAKAAPASPAKSAKAPAKKADAPAAPLKGRAKSVATQFANLSEADRKAILAMLAA